MNPDPIIPDNPPTVVCIGDSLVRGFASSNFVLHLSALRPEFSYFNFGSDGALAADIKDQLARAIQQQPQLIILLIGTNDARYTLDKSKAKRNSQQQASVEEFKNHAMLAVNKLLKETASQILILSIPVVDESLGHEIESILKGFNSFLRQLCDNPRLCFIDITSEILHEIKVNKLRTKPWKDKKYSMYYALFLHYCLRLPWDKISSLRGSLFHVDYVHLNDRAARLIAQKISASL